MSLKTLDHFTFLFLLKSKRNGPEKRAMLDAVRSFINTVDSFRDAKVTIKPTRIAIEHKDYYFCFDARGIFNMGFSSGEDKIAFLNNAMNEVCKKFDRKVGGEEKMEIDITSVAEYIINEKCNLFTKLVLDQNLHKISYQNGVVVPTAIDLTCRGADRDNSIDVTLSRKNEENKLAIVLYKDRNKHLILDAAKEAAEVINEMASRISKELISEN